MSNEHTVKSYEEELQFLKDSLIEIVQSEEFGPIHIKGIEEVH